MASDRPGCSGRLQPGPVAVFARDRGRLTRAPGRTDLRPRASPELGTNGIPRGIHPPGGALPAGVVARVGAVGRHFSAPRTHPGARARPAARGAGAGLPPEIGRLVPPSGTENVMRSVTSLLAVMLGGALLAGHVHAKGEGVGLWIEGTVANVRAEGKGRISCSPDASGWSSIAATYGRSSRSTAAAAFPSPSSRQNRSSR